MKYKQIIRPKQKKINYSQTISWPILEEEKPNLHEPIANVSGELLSRPHPKTFHRDIVLDQFTQRLALKFSVGALPGETRPNRFLQGCVANSLGEALL